MAYYLTYDERWNDLASALVGCMDIIAGLLIYLSKTFNFESNPAIIVLSLFYFCLGIWALGINIKRRNYLEWKGVIDLVTATILFLIYYGNILGAFEILGISIIIKGVLGLLLITTVEH